MVDIQRQGEVDSVILEVLWNRLLAIAEEQARSLFRASFTTAVGDSEDYASTIHDAEGNMIAQSVSTGTISMLTGVARSVKALFKHYPAESLSPGDILICNDPWLFSGHKFDVTVVTPVFYRQSLVGFTATNVHVVDIGGIGMSAASKDTYEEGLTIPPLKFFRKGEPNEDLFKIIRHNVRSPEEVIGDLMAQVSANEVGARKITQFLEEYELGSLVALSNSIIGRSEAAARKAIWQLPDGVYRHEVLTDGLDTPLKVSAELTVNGTDIVVDFAGSSPQVERGINCVMNVTYGYTCHAIKSALVPYLPNNEGFFRPVKVVAPEACVLNARFPAPVMARHLMYSFISAAVFGALAKVIPEKVIADSGRGVIPALSGVDNSGKRFTYWFMANAGMGARPTADGFSGTNYPGSVGTVPVEMIESVSPVLITRKGFVQDSGGPGRFRGGLDQETSFVVRTNQPVVFSCMLERTKFPASGIQGGMSGLPARVLVDGKPINSKERYTLQPGEEVTISGGGGGGFFPPDERDPESVLKDVVGGYISTKQAVEVYKVAVDAATGTIDWKTTNELRV